MFRVVRLEEGQRCLFDGFEVHSVFSWLKNVKNILKTVSDSLTTVSISLSQSRQYLREVFP